MDTTIERAQEIGNFGFWEFDLQTRKLSWSDHVFKIFGKDINQWEPTYEGFVECIHEDDRSMVHEAYDRSVKEKEPYAIEHRIVLSDGSIRYVSEKCETTFDEAGNPIRSFGSVHDITDKTEAINKLKDSEQKFKAISNQTTEGVTVADMDGNYVFVNPAFCTMSGYSREELLKLTVFDMKAANQDHSSFRDSKEKMEGTPIRVNLQRKDGSEYFTEIIGNVLNVGDETYVLGTIRDISDQVAYEEKITQLNKSLESKVEERTQELNETVRALNEEIAYRKEIENELKESLDVKEILLKEITHRVKNKLQIISSLISLQKNNMDEGSSDFLDQINHRIHSMALIHETLSKTNEYKEVRFKDYTDSLLKYLTDSYSSGQISVVSEIDEIKLPLEIATNCGMIIMELITNSVKYAFSDTDNPSIHISFRKENESDYILQIADNGSGFPTDINFRDSNSLGLQLVTSLTEQLNGSIEQEVNGGTKYTIKFSKATK
jgi:PAS domain S-box-containing protein